MRGVVGTDKARPYAAQAPAEFDPMYPYIDSDLGGYGLYYGTTMAATGLVIPALPQAGVPFDAPTRPARRRRVPRGDRGHGVLPGVRRAPGPACPAAVVLEYARAACLCQLQTDSAPDRPLLRDVFCYGGEPEEAAQRRASLRFFLDLSAVTDGVPVDQDTFRRLIYFRDLGNGLRYVPRAEVARTARRWRLYQAREYYSLALNRLWALLTAWGAGRSAAGAVSVPVADWWYWLDSAMDFGPVGGQLGVGDPGISSSAPLADLADWITAIAGTAANVDGIWPQNSALTEDRLASSARRLTHDPALAAAIIALLLLIRERVGRPARQIQIGEDMDILAAGGAERLAMTRFFDRARRAIMSGATVGEFARSLVLDFVIRQHQRVAMSKLPDDTFRFRRDGDRLRFSRFGLRPGSTTRGSPRCPRSSPSWALPAACSQPIMRSPPQEPACSRLATCPSGR